MIDPTEAGWLAKYLEIRRELPFDERVAKIDNPEYKYYAHLHNSGLLYGHPIKLPLELELDMLQWPVKERMKVIFAEAFYSACLIFKPASTGNTAEDFGGILSGFYSVYRPELLKASLFALKKAKTDAVRAEQALDRRIKVKSQWNATFWRGFFHNILLFVDIIHFIEYLLNGPESLKARLQDDDRRIRMQALRLIALASNADGASNKNEQQLFDYFLESAELPKEQNQKAKALTQAGLKLNNFVPNPDASWLERKYFLELAILTLWADRKITAAEETFLHKLAAMLQLDEEEVDRSVLSVQSFVMNNWERIHYLQEKQNFFILRKHLTERMSKIAKKYARQIGQEISESKELMDLFKLSSERELTTSEKDQIRQQLFDILKSVPAFVILMLPFSFLTIPVLIKIIPKNAFPDSFDPNRLNVKKRGNRTIDL
jgi:hypothetical protein